ncbi:MAG TPA: hypothetical protein VFW83_07910 [Bryobacteraceae bacterium]|nr:hypothetical protein [Bryobacteraceae bacterium]
MRTLLPVSLLLALAAAGQTPQPTVSPEWDITQTTAALSTQAERIQPVLMKLKPEVWVKNGAPGTYVSQWRSAQNDLNYVAGSAKALEQDPERLTLALDTYFRLQAFEAQIGSLVNAVRKYQSPSVGDQLVSLVAENASNRDKLRQYITDLAAQKEQEFSIVDKEAQRCRGALSASTPPPSPKNAPKSRAKKK